MKVNEGGVKLKDQKEEEKKHDPGEVDLICSFL